MRVQEVDKSIKRKIMASVMLMDVFDLQCMRSPLVRFMVHGSRNRDALSPVRKKEVLVQ
jgi:hypothetical protein